MIDHTIEQLMEAHKVPGLSLAILEEGHRVQLKTYGLQRADAEDLIDIDTTFEAASLSKPVFAYGVLKMVERGEIDLDQPLSHYLPAYDVKDPRLTHITARMVLSHSTGFPNWRPENQSLCIHFQPGERFSYSGEGFVYLQRVIESLSGHSLEEYMQGNVLQPLDMRQS